MCGKPNLHSLETIVHRRFRVILLLKATALHALLSFGYHSDILHPSVCSSFSSFVHMQDTIVRRFIMTDGEGREHFHYLERDEVRVPISALYRAPALGADEEEKSSTWVPVHESARAQGARDPTPDLVSDEEEQPPYPALAPVVFFCIKQTTRPRSWCLRMVCNPYPLCSACMKRNRRYNRACIHCNLHILGLSKV